MKTVVHLLKLLGSFHAVWMHAKLPGHFPEHGKLLECAGKTL